MSGKSWYIELQEEKNIEQGDLFDNCPVIIPPKNLQKNMQVRVKEYKVIVLSQTCDIRNDKIDTILVCPYYTLEELEKGGRLFKSKVGKEILRRGNIIGMHLLNKTPLHDDFIVIDFRKVYSIHKNVLYSLLSEKNNRLRLKSPYRENLSQSFGRFFMRVGLPDDIQPFCEEIYKIN